MIISCPNCGTQYSIDPVAFGRAAKSVRCFNCSNQWLQQPVVLPPVFHPQPPQYQQAPPGYPPPQGYPGYPPPPPGYPPQSYPPGYPPEPDMPPVAPPHHAETAEAPAPVPLPEPSFDLDGLTDEEEHDANPLSAGINALFESDDDDDDDLIDFDLDAVDSSTPDLSDTDEIPGPITPADDPDLSQDALDSLFDEDDATDGIGSMIEATPPDDGDDGFDSIDDIPEPDPLPESLTADIDDDDMDDDDAPKSRRGRKKKPTKGKKKGGAGLIIALVLVLLLGGTGAGMFFLRDMVLQYVPALGVVYEMVGLSAALGEGLEIRDVKSERGTTEGVDFLMLSGKITSVAEKPMPVPLIKALLIDAEGETIQSVIQEPGATEIAAGKVLGFAVKIDEPSPLARRLEVTFEPRPTPEN